MGFKANKIVYKELPKETVDPLTGLPSFTEDDFAYLFFKLENMEFKGNEMERAYNLTLKLQTLYTYLKARDKIKK